MSHGAIGSPDRSLSALQWLKNYGENTTDGNMKLNQNFQEFIKSFVAHDVRYLIVGGYAMAAHGHPRYTKDLDVRVGVDPTNSQKIVSALTEFGFGELGLTVADFLDPDVVVQLGREPQRIDFVSIDDLRRNKLATGRLRDQADASELPPGD